MEVITRKKKYDSYGILIEETMDSSESKITYTREITRDSKDRITKSVDKFTGDNTMPNETNEYVYLDPENPDYEALHKLFPDNTMIERTINGKTNYKVFIDPELAGDNYLFSTLTIYNDKVGDMVKIDSYDISSLEEIRGFKPYMKTNTYRVDPDGSETMIESRKEGYVEGTEFTNNIERTMYSENKAIVYQYDAEKVDDDNIIINCTGKVDDNIILKETIKKNIKNDIELESVCENLNPITNEWSKENRTISINPDTNIVEDITRRDDKITSKVTYILHNNDLYELNKYWADPNSEDYENIDNEYDFEMRVTSHIIERYYSDKHTTISKTSTIFDESGNEIMTTFEDTIKAEGKPDQTITKHVIKEYDNNQNCIHEITETYDARSTYENDKEILRTIIAAQPNQKDLFDHYYNKVIQYVVEREEEED